MPDSSLPVSEVTSADLATLPADDMQGTEEDPTVRDVIADFLRRSLGDEDARDYVVESLDTVTFTGPLEPVDHVIAGQLLDYAVPALIDAVDDDDSPIS